MNIIKIAMPRMAYRQPIRCMATMSLSVGGSFGSGISGILPQCPNGSLNKSPNIVVTH